LCLRWAWILTSRFAMESSGVSSSSKKSALFIAAFGLGATCGLAGSQGLSGRAGLLGVVRVGVGVRVGAGLVGAGNVTGISLNSLLYKLSKFCITLFMLCITFLQKKMGAIAGSQIGGGEGSRTPVQIQLRNWVYMLGCICNFIGNGLAWRINLCFRACPLQSRVWSHPNDCFTSIHCSALLIVYLNAFNEIQHCFCLGKKSFFNFFDDELVCVVEDVLSLC